MIYRASILALVLCAVPSALAAQIAVSGNDGKQHGADTPHDAQTPDSISILDLSSRPIKILATLHAPASMIGPPASIAVSRDSGFAIVTAAQRIDASGATVPADIVTVIDLAHPAAARVLQTLHAGSGASGVAINPAGTVALVANAADDSVSVFTISNKVLAPAGTIPLDAGSKPVDLAFSPDGASAFVVTQIANAMVRLAVDGTRVTRSGAPIPLGVQPYSLSVDRRGAFGFVTNLSGRAATAAAGPKMGTIAVVDLHAGRMIGQVDAGNTPEHAGLSPSGRYLQVTLINGSNAAQTSPDFNPHGRLLIYRVRGPKLSRLASVETGRWCQGSAWSDDEKLVLLQCGAAKQIEAYRFDGRTLRRDPADTLQLDARPGAMATARSR